MLLLLLFRIQFSVLIKSFTYSTRFSKHEMYINGVKQESKSKFRAFMEYKGMLHSCIVWKLNFILIRTSKHQQHFLLWMWPSFSSRSRWWFQGETARYFWGRWPIGRRSRWYQRWCRRGCTVTNLRNSGHTICYDLRRKFKSGTGSEREIYKTYRKSLACCQRISWFGTAIRWKTSPTWWSIISTLLICSIPVLHYK